MPWNQNIFLHPSFTECQSNSDHKGESFHVYTHRDKSATLKNLPFPVHVIFANIHFMAAADFPKPFPSVPTHRTQNARSAEKYLSLDKIGEVSPKPRKIPRHSMNNDVVRTGFFSATPQTAAKASLKGIFFFFQSKMPGNKQSREIKLGLDLPLSAPVTKPLCHCEPHCWGGGWGERGEGRHTGGKKNAVYKIDATYNPWHSVLQRLLLR